MSELILTIEGIDPLDLYGENNAKLNLLKKAYPDIQITSRGNQVKLKGDKKGTDEVKTKLEIMIRMIQDKHDFSTQVVEDLLVSDHAADNKISQHSAGGVIVYGKNGQPIKAKTKNQKLLVECSEANDIVFAIGPAGTGKTYTAMALAIRALKSKLVKKIILTRPAVEAGEHLGFLPGDMKEIMNQVLVAEKKAQANSIMRREETAAMLSMLNTAKLMEENEMLWKLKEMEYVEKIADRIGEITISGSGNVISQLKDIFVK